MQENPHLVCNEMAPENTDQELIYLLVFLAIISRQITKPYYAYSANVSVSGSGLLMVLWTNYR